MKYIGIDLSISHTGLSIIDENENILVTHEIVTDTSKSTWFRIISTIQQLSLFLEDFDGVAIEDVFLGVNFKAAKDAIRLSGALMYHCFLRTKKEPLLLMAVSARKLCGIKGTSQKAEVQLFILKKFSLAKDSELKDYEFHLYELLTRHQHLLVDLKRLKKIKEDESIIRTHCKSINAAKRDITKLSVEIEKKFELSEHVADSLVLSLAIKRYTEAQQKVK